jgi:flagellum-specific ATP synthase
MGSFAARVDRWVEDIQLPPPPAQGVLTRVVGLTLEASGINASIGSRCDVIAPDGKRVQAEVVGFSDGRLLLMPFERTRGIAPGFRVVVRSTGSNFGFSESMLGRVFDGMGMPLDDGDPITPTAFRSINADPINPLSRRPINEPLDVGVRAINSLLTVGRGQRLGLMAGSGVGKSVLLGMMTRYTKADVVVIGLIGERGREVHEFVRDTLGEEGMRRAVVIAAPGDTSPVSRLHGASLATAVAEYFRDQGKHVLLLMDSLTRVAHAQREIGLAVGEPPTTKGYPPSVFTLMPSLIERAGNTNVANGSITAFYTVLAEGDDQQDPIVDAARAILDGHIVLTRELAAQGHFPAIDILQSVSRLMPQLAKRQHQEAAKEFRRVYSAYEEHRDLISVGAYQRGANADVDQAIRQLPFIKNFLQQDMSSAVSFSESLDQLQNIPEEVDDANEDRGRKLKMGKAATPNESEVINGQY